MKLPLKVVPASSRDRIAGWLGERLKVRVRAPAERGKANAAAETMIANALDVPRENVLIVTGKTSAHKVVEISGMCEPEVYRRLKQF
jgi:uncharacterized protein (TIGR00251 family)